MRVETAPAGLELGQLALPALVGRAAELDQQLEAVTGPPAVVVVEGEAGVGKTRLVGEMLLAPELRGRRTLVGSCQPFREPQAARARARADRRRPAAAAARALRCDEGSGDLVRFLISRLPGELCLVLTLRREELPAAVLPGSGPGFAPRGKGEFEAQVSSPSLGLTTGAVSLKAEAWDVEGNRIE
jgi:hypothetical protein